MTEAQKHNRARIERVWRDVNGHDESTDLVGSDKEWELLERLLAADPKGD